MDKLSKITGIVDIFVFAATTLAIAVRQLRWYCGISTSGSFTDI